MQYSTNSDEAIRHIIRSHPTPAGQYRQAVIQRRDRMIALANHNFVEARQEQEIKLRQVRYNRLNEQLKVSAGIDAVEIQTAIKLTELEIAQLMYEQDRAAELKGDCQREIAACDAEILRLITETGIDFGALPDREFQKYMAEDYQQRQIRWMAARTMALHLGLPVEVAETLLELPEPERSACLEAQKAIVQSCQEKLSPLQLNGKPN